MRSPLERRFRWCLADGTAPLQQAAGSARTTEPKIMIVPNISIQYAEKERLYEHPGPAYPLRSHGLHDRPSISPGFAIEPTFDFLSHRRNRRAKDLLSRGGAGQCADRAHASWLSVLIANVGAFTATSGRQISSHRP